MASVDVLIPIWGGGPQNGLQITPNFVTFPVSIWPIWKAKKILVFQSDFGCLKRGGGVQPPRHLTYIFDPVLNRVNPL